MKIVCQSCNAAFNIDDAKIPKGKKVGVKCKSCGAVIVILPDGSQEGAAAPQAEAAPPPKPAPAPKPAAPPPVAAETEDPFGGGDDPFAGLSEDKLEVEGSVSPPDDFNFSAEEEAPPEPVAPPPPKPKKTAAGAGAANDPFADHAPEDPFATEESEEPIGGGAFAGASEIDTGGGAGRDADGNFSFDDGGGGDALDELDALDRQVEQEIKKGRAAPAAGTATIGFDDDAFTDTVAVAAGHYKVKNAKGQLAGPFPIGKIKDLLKSKKIGAKDEISRDEGPWLPVRILLEIPNIENTDLEKFLATASAEAAGAGGFNFDADAIGATGLGGGGMAGNISLIIKVAVGVVVLAIAAGGAFWWYQMREVDFSQLNTAKLRELVSSRQSVTSSREAVSRQSQQKAEAIVSALLVEQFPEAEKELKTAIQKNPSNFQAAALLARLYAFWAEMLGERTKLADGQAMAEAVKGVDATAEHTLIAFAHVLRVAGKTDEAIAVAQNAATVAAGSADAQVALAYALLGKPDQFAAAQAALDKAFAVGGEHQLALIVQARLHELQKDYTQASEGYDKAISARPNAVYPRLMKAQFILRRMPDQSRQAVELLDAVEKIPLAAVKPFRARVLVVRAALLMADGQAGSALAKAREADQVFPSAESKTIVGDALFAAGQVSDALISYAEAIKVDRTYQAAHQRIGRAHLAIGENDKGEAALKEAIRLDTGDLSARVLLGQAYARSGRVELAQIEYEAVIGIDPQNADAYVSLGQLQLTQGRTQDALASFDRAIELDPQNPETFVAIGRTYWELGESSSAISRTRQAVELAPLRIATHQQLAKFLWEIGDYAAALSAYDQAVQLLKTDDQNSQLYVERAIVKFYLGRYEEAVADLNQALVIRKSEPQVYFWIARSRLAQAEALVAQAKTVPVPEADALFQAANGEFSKADYYARENPIIAYWWGRAWAGLRQYAQANQQLDVSIRKAQANESQGWSPFIDPDIAKARILTRQEKWREAHAMYEQLLPKLAQEEERIRTSKKYAIVPETAPLAEQFLDWHPRRWPKWEADRLQLLGEIQIEALQVMGYVERDELDRPAQSDATLKRLLSIRPAIPKAHLYRCLIAMDKQDYVGGEGHCRQAIRYDSNLGEAHVQIGYSLLYEKNDSRGAVASWSRALAKTAQLSDKRKMDVIGAIRGQGLGEDEIRRILVGHKYQPAEMAQLGVR